MPPKLTQEQFNNKVKEIDPSFEVIGKYEGYYYPDGKQRKILLRHECGYEDEYCINNFMYHRCKCRKCYNLIPMTHEMYVEKVSTLNPTIEIIGKFKGTNKKIDCRCKVCNYSWATDAQQLYNHGCPSCAGVVKTPEMYYEEVEEKFPNQYEFLTEYTAVYNDITVRNKNCGHEFTSRAVNILRGECKCPYCNGKKILVGFNDLWTTRPDIARMLVNPDDGYKYTYNSGKKLEWKCLDCNTSYIKAVYDVVNNGLRCVHCSDNFPIGEKIIHALLKYLDIDFEYQKKFDWSSNRKYDFYINDKNLIVEVNGIQHYYEKLHFTHTSLSDIQENDANKLEMAMNNGVDKYIYIDSSSSDFLIIKDNILHSELKNILPLDILTEDDWIEIARKSSRSFLIICSDLWNDGWCVKQIKNELKIHDKTVKRYLISAQKLNLCDYNASESVSRWRKYNEQCK